MSCEIRCTVTEPAELPANNMPPPAGGGGDFNGIATANTPSVVLTGNGLAGAPLRATLQPVTIEFEVAFSVPGTWATQQFLMAYVAAHAFTLQATLPGLQTYVRTLTADATVNLFKVSGPTETPIGSIVVTPAGAQTVTFATDVDFAVDDVLIARAGSDNNFDIIAMTIIGLRALAIAA